MPTLARETWREAFDAQVETSRWYGTQAGLEWLAGLFSTEVDEMKEQSSRTLLRGAYATESERLAGAVPFFVSRDMCEVVEHAAQTFQPEPIYPTDVLDLNGFLYFERPFTIPDRFERPVKIKGFSWQPAMDERDLMRAERMLTRDDEMREWLEQRHQDGYVDGLMLTLYQPGQEGAPPVMPLHMTPWWWGMSFDGNEVTAEGRPSGASWWWRIVQVTLRLMQQQITSRRFEKPYRQRRKEAARYGVYGHDTVVVTLRREAGERHDPSGEEANYSHRFMVGGHWRNQWYPSQGVHRQIYIAPYVKGPEDLPLIIKPRAYNWSR